MEDNVFKKTIQLLRSADIETKRESFVNLRRYRPIVFTIGIFLCSIFVLLFAIALPEALDKGPALLYAVILLVVAAWNTERLLKHGVTTEGKIFKHQYGISQNNNP